MIATEPQTAEQSEHRLKLAIDGMKAIQHAAEVSGEEAVSLCDFGHPSKKGASRRTRQLVRKDRPARRASLLYSRRFRLADRRGVRSRERCSVLQTDDSGTDKGKELSRV